MDLGDFSEKGLEPGGLPPGLLTFLGLPPLPPIIQIILKKIHKKTIPRSKGEVLLLISARKSVNYPVTKECARITMLCARSRTDRPEKTYEQ